MTALWEEGSSTGSVFTPIKMNVIWQLENFRFSESSYEVVGPQDCFKTVKSWFENPCGEWELWLVGTHQGEATCEPVSITPAPPCQPVTLGYSWWHDIVCHAILWSVRSYGQFFSKPCVHFLTWIFISNWQHCRFLYLLIISCYLLAVLCWGTCSNFHPTELE